LVYQGKIFIKYNSYVRDSVLDESELVLGAKAQVSMVYQAELALKEFKGQSKNGFNQTFNSNENLLKLARSASTENHKKRKILKSPEDKGITTCKKKN
jgi:hypothetical protein